MTRAGGTPRTMPGMEALQSDESQKTLSLMGGVVKPEGLPEADAAFGVAKGPSKLFSQGTLLILLVACIAAGSIYAMKAAQGEIALNPAAKEVEARVEQALAKLTNPQALPQNDPLLKRNLDDLFRDTAAIIAMFSDDMTQRQVPIEFVQKNPFLVWQPAPTVVSDAAPVNDDRGVKKLRNELSRLKVQTIMFSSRPVAVIDGEIVQPGAQLGSFTVKEIKQFSVVLEAAGQIFTLAMEKDEAGKKR